MIRKKGHEYGSWYRLRHVNTQAELWVGSIYVPPHHGMVDLQTHVSGMLSVLPACNLPVVLMGDTNAGLKWSSVEGQGTAAGADGKGRVLIDCLASQGFALVAPREDQYLQPTSRPRKTDATGRIIDWGATKRARVGIGAVAVDSCYTIGADHDAYLFPLTLRLSGHPPKRHALGRRVVTSDITSVPRLCQTEMRTLAQTHTAPPASTQYKDDAATKTLFQMAKHSKSSEDWKLAFRARRKSMQLWKQKQVEEACSGNWQAYKACQLPKHPGWESHLADAVSPQDPHQTAHDHYAQIFQGPPVDLPPLPPPPRSPDFTCEELDSALAAGKGQKSVGIDGVSLELLKLIRKAPNGAHEMLKWFNSLLHDGQLPEDWSKTIMVLLPKTSHPNQISETRPISIGTATEKIFCRMVLARCTLALTPQKPWQCCGPRRQSLDYLHVIMRLLENEREWGKSLTLLKVDLMKAFDTVDRKSLLLRLRDKLGNTEEYRVWEWLLSGSSAILQSPWGSSTFDVNRGIRQGAVESPLMFAAILEWVLDDASNRYRWNSCTSTYPDLPLTQTAYMDDVMIWDGHTQELQLRVEQLGKELALWGLSINLKKCSLYTSPQHRGPNYIEVGGKKLYAQPSINVMGVEFHIGASTHELLQATWQRAKGKFWANKHLLCASTPLSGRLQLLDRVIGGAALWNIAAFFPDPTTMEALNNLQVQFVIWMLHPRKAASEPWVAFRQRSVRQARQVIHMHLGTRWPTQWLRRYWKYSGHTARSLLTPSPTAASILCHFRTAEWWDRQQRLSYGMRHTGRFFPKLSPMDRRMNRAAGGCWREKAMDRSAWRNACDVWISQQDLPWASGNQFALTW